MATAAPHAFACGGPLIAGCPAARHRSCPAGVSGLPASLPRAAGLPCTILLTCAGRRPGAVTIAAGGEKGSSSTSTTSRQEEVDEVTRKWGLEMGLWKALRGKEQAQQAGQEEAPQAVSREQGEAQSPGQAAGTPPSNTELAKELLAKYGGAYLATSISLALVSFSFFYALVDRGVDVASLLQQFGISVDSTSETVGTVAIAYAAHKAASPIRFPPTVILTPIVANFLGKKGESSSDKTEG